MNAVDPAIVICTEKGSLEYKALCLVLTLRANWGKWADTPIYCYSPRQGRGISPWLADIFRAHGVTLITEPLNKTYVDYPLANKPLAMAHAESNTSHDLLVFLDSDILCWNEPTAFDLPTGKSIGLVADGTKSVASDGPGDANEPMWQSLYELAGVAHEPYVTTTLTLETVRGWWGSGVIAVQRSSGFMNEWLNFFTTALEKVEFRKEAYYLREQMTLCAIAARHYPRLHEMPVSHNFPVQNYSVFHARGVDPHAVVLWHYQPFLNKAVRRFSQRLDAVSSSAAKETLAQEFIADLWKNYPRRIGLDEPLYAAWRRRLRIGPRLRAAMGRSLPTD